MKGCRMFTAVGVAKGTYFHVAVIWGCAFYATFMVPLSGIAWWSLALAHGVRRQDLF